MKILIVDDNETNSRVLSLILQKAGYSVCSLIESLKVLETIQTFNPDLLLLDINMPGKSGFEVCQEIKAIDDYKYLPIIFISALSDSDNIVKGFNLGASDYIVKPFKKEEVIARVSNLLNVKVLQDELNKQNKNLEKRLIELVQENSQAQMQTIFSLAKLAQSRDDDTGMHLERVRTYCEIIAKELQTNSCYSDEIDEDFIFSINMASPLHDIGKVGIPDRILLKPGKLTPEEFEIMKTHSAIGYQTLCEADMKFGSNSFIKMGKIIARNHHERFDGNGYPDKLAGTEIPLPARIMALADVYDALRSKRVYKEAFSQEKTLQIITSEKGKQFDAVIVEAFLRVQDEFFKTSINASCENSLY